MHVCVCVLKFFCQDLKYICILKIVLSLIIWFHSLGLINKREPLLATLPDSHCSDAPITDGSRNKNLIRPHCLRDRGLGLCLFDFIPLVHEQHPTYS